MNKICGIYKITSPSKRVYIGQSIDCKRRKSSYRNGHTKGQSRLENSIKKYGWDKHQFEILHQCDVNQLNELEVYYIALFQCFNSKYGLNLQSGGSERLVSDETRDRLSKSQTGKKLSVETKNKISQSHKGKKLSEETKLKIAESSKGRIFSDESRLKKGNSLKGKVRSEEHCKNISEANIGHKHSEETKRLMSISKIGVKRHGIKRPSGLNYKK